MSLCSKKSAGSPKTARGKQVSSQNALVYDANRLKISGYQIVLRISNSIQELFDNNNKDYSELTELLYLGLGVMQARARGDEMYTIKANKLQDEEDLDAKKIMQPYQQLSS